MLNCKTCACVLGRYNKSGYCKKHVSAAFAADPVWREKQRDGARRSLHADPERLAAKRRLIAAVGSTPKAVEARRQSCIDRKLWLQGHEVLAANGAEARRKAGERGSATKLAHIPPHLRGQYRQLTALGIRAPEATRLITEQHELEMARWRREISGGAKPAVLSLPPEPPAAGDEIDRVAAMLNVGRAEVPSPSRTPLLVDARATVAVLLRAQGVTFEEIGRRLGRDHTSVVHLVKTFPQRAARNLALQVVLQRLSDQKMEAAA